MKTAYNLYNYINIYNYIYLHMYLLLIIFFRKHIFGSNFFLLIFVIDKSSKRFIYFANYIYMAFYYHNRCNAVYKSLFVFLERPICHILAILRWEKTSSGSSSLDSSQRFWIPRISYTYRRTKRKIGTSNKRQSRI